MLTTLLARCFGRVWLRDDAAATLAVTGDPVLVPAEGTIGSTIDALVAAIQGSVVRTELARTLYIHVGPNPPRRWIPCIAGSAWRGVLWPSYGAPSVYAARPNALGAFVAALLGATQVTRDFIEAVTRTTTGGADKPIVVDAGLRARYGTPLGQVTISAADVMEHGIEEGDTLVDDLGTLTLVSLGAVNGAALYLVRAVRLRATVTGYEPQDLKRTNLNRYLYALARHVGGAKAVAAEELATTTLAICARRQAVEDIPSTFVNVVLCGVDNNAARWETQRRSADWLLSLESEVSQVTFTMHAPGEGPCARCAHPSNLAPDPEQPTHPVVSAWPALLAVAALVRGKLTWTAGLQIRLDGLDPRDRAGERIRALADCPHCSEKARIVLLTTSQP